jgi:hypothetical protein
MLLPYSKGTRTFQIIVSIFAFNFKLSKCEISWEQIVTSSSGCCVITKSLFIFQTHSCVVNSIVSQMSWDGHCLPIRSRHLIFIPIIVAKNWDVSPCTILPTFIFFLLYIVSNNLVKLNVYDDRISILIRIHL